MNSPRTLLLVGLALLLAVGIYFGTRHFGRQVVGPHPDLTFSSVLSTHPLIPQPNQTVELKLMVANIGEGLLEEGELEVVAFDADPREESDAERVASGSIDVEIPSGHRRMAVLEYETPEAPKDLSLFFVIDPDERVRETSRENNFFRDTLHVVAPRPAMPDLVVEELRFDPAAPRANQDILLVAVVKNQGDGATLAPTVLDFYVNDNLGPRARLPGSVRLPVPILDSGEQVEITTRTRFDEPQVVAVHAGVDTDELIPELNVANNVNGPAYLAVGTPDQSGSPDLVVEAIELDPGDAVLGQTGRLRVQVANRGGADTTVPFAIKVDFGHVEGPLPGFPPYQAWERDLRFLAAGQSYRLPEIPVPYNRAGDWKAVVAIDPYGEVDEGQDQGENNRQEFAWRVQLPE